MTKQQSEGEVHVAAMRLILAAMERSEDPPDWTIWQHMLGMLETIFQGIEEQRRDDQDELFFTRQNLDAKQAEMLGAVGHLRQDRDHWKEARQDAHEAGDLMRAEIDTLRQQLDAALASLTGQRLNAEERDREIETLRKQLDAAQVGADAVWVSARNLQKERDHWKESRQQAIEAGELMRAEIDTLRQQLANAQRQASDEFIERQVLQHEASGDFVELARLRAFVGQVRQRVTPMIDLSDVEFLRAALAALDAGTPQPATCPECERLHAVIDQAWQRIKQSVSHADVAGLLAVLAEIQSNSSTPAPVAEPLEAEGGA